MDQILKFIRSPGLALVGILILGGCGANDPESSSAPATGAAASPEPQAHPALAAAGDSLASGELDVAAARLMQIRMSGYELAPAEAAEFREILSATYSRALEASQKGDPRAQATLQMIRAMR